MSSNREASAIGGSSFVGPHFGGSFTNSPAEDAWRNCRESEANCALEPATGSTVTNLPAVRSTAKSNGQSEPHGKLLVVEDDAGSRSVLQNMLAASGHHVTCAGSSTEAQQLVLADQFDLVIFDVFLPDMDGIELTRWLRAQPQMASVPVVLVTCRDDTKIMARGLETGADDFLFKPFNAPELRTRIRSLLRNKSLADELRAREEAVSRFIVPSSVLRSASIHRPHGPDDRVHSRSGYPATTNTDERTDEATSTELRAATVLIIDDQEPQRELLKAYLEQMDCRIQIANEGRSAIQSLEENPPELVVLDLGLSGTNGYELIQEVKGNTRFAHIPILVVSGTPNVQDRVKALELGADDFTIKGFDALEFKARVRRLLETKRRFDSLTNRCDQALRQAMTDSLTGLFTHGFLWEMLQREVSCARRHGEQFSLLFADIDHFKQINHRYGHAAGDYVLKVVAQTVRESVRDSDMVARYGGDEFVVLLPHTDPAGARNLAERIRSAVESRPVGLAGAAAWDCLQFTVSAGVTTFPDNAADAESLLQHADEAMYAAKQFGRNRVVPFGESDATDRRQPRVLIVDDSETDLQRLEIFLQPQDYRTLKTRDGQEALDLARRVRPDLILLDAVMPQLDGFEVCRRLKQGTGTCLIPVVLVTRLNKREDKLRGIEAGADDFLTKPVHEAELLARVRALLRTKRNTDLLEDAETVIFTLARAVEGRDPSTGDHVERVSRYAVELGKALGLPAAQVDGLRRAGYVHDIGKIAVPDAILLKPGKLTPDERKIMEQHVEIGYELLRPLRTFGEALPAVRCHHERRDGSGYPLGLRGDQVPVIAQIMAIVDVYDALTTDRVYRAALSQTEACGILREEAARGLHHPKLVETFIQLVSTN